MKKTNRTRITVERERLLVISRRSHGRAEIWCEWCGALVRMLAVDEAATVSGLSQRAIFHQVETGTLHFQETREREVLICLNSLLQP